MALQAFTGCVFALEVVYVFVNIQMLELLDTAVNIATYLMRGASARIQTTESLSYEWLFHNTPKSGSVYSNPPWAMRQVHKL